MERQHIDPFEHAGAITRPNPGGILLTTKADGEVGTMMIGWGPSAPCGANPPSQPSSARVDAHALLERNPEFTANVPLEGERLDRCVLAVIVGKSGRSVNKTAALSRVPNLGAHN